MEVFMRLGTSHLVAVLFVLILTQAARAQLTVFDPTNYANAVQEFQEL
jgi:conjugal transfer/entry exclusion protein